MPSETEMTAEWTAGYEVGYRDGESSGYADWVAALGDEFDLGDAEGPIEVLAIIKASLHARYRQGIEDAAAKADEMDCGLPTWEYTDDVGAAIRSLKDRE